MLTPHVVSYNAAICVRMCWKEALHLLQAMHHRLLSPDVISCNAAVSACEKGKHCKEALGLLLGGMLR